MTEIFNRLYALRVRRSLGGTHAQFRMANQHYLRFASMYGAEHNFSIAR